jgi:phosphatidylinositol glycan class W
MLLFAAVEDVGPAMDPDETSMTSPSKNATSRILAAFNGNGLVVFLVANLLTGLVNLTVNTLDTPPLAAVAVLVAYAAALTAFALILDKAGLKIKI